MTNAETVMHVYDRFAQEDAPAILAVFDPAIEFRLAEGHPYRPDGSPMVGPDAVTRDFFMKAGGEWERWTVKVQQVTELAGTVVVEGRYDGLYKPTGRRLDVQVCHVWKFNDQGKATSFHQYLDTARLRQVMAQGSGGSR